MFQTPFKPSDIYNVSQGNSTFNLVACQWKREEGSEKQESRGKIRRQAWLAARLANVNLKVLSVHISTPAESLAASLCWVRLRRQQNNQTVKTHSNSKLCRIYFVRNVAEKKPAGVSVQSEAKHCFNKKPVKNNCDRDAISCRERLSCTTAGRGVG